MRPRRGSQQPYACASCTSHVESFAFNDETDMLVALADGRLRSWCFPALCFVDKDLLSLTESSSDAAEFGHGAQILAFPGNRIVLRKVDGSVLFTSSPLDLCSMSMPAGASGRKASCRHRRERLCGAAWQAWPWPSAS